MTDYLTIGLFIAMGLTVAVLAFGLITMARGGDFNRRWSNKLMRYRILFQFAALVIFAAILLIGKYGGGSGG